MIISVIIFDLLIWCEVIDIRGTRHGIVTMNSDSTVFYHIISMKDTL